MGIGCWRLRINRNDIDMEDLMDKDKTIAILRHQYERERKENQILKEEIALLEYEIEQLKQQIK
ncbi:conserved hypothetical protein [Bacteroides sp. 3_1_19]|nr:conserved hypothetical protein [Bacteroides sp. 3_1_19]